VGKSVSDEDEVSESVKFVEYFESLVHDGTVFGLKKSLDRLLFNVTVDPIGKFRLRKNTKKLFLTKNRCFEGKKDFILASSINGSINLEMLILTENGLIISQLCQFFKVIIGHELMKKVHVLFYLYFILSFIINDIKELFIRNVIVYQMINQSLTKSKKV
jgi:hypothetical protein